jgi:hypothetical protein
VATITATQLLVARRDVPARVIRDILEVVYDPRFGRDLQFAIDEQHGREVEGLPLHRAAEIYYHRNDLPTSDRLGRLSFVASAIAGLAATMQFVSRYRRGERIARRRRLLEAELTKLQSIRTGILDAPDGGSARTLMREADDLLTRAEQDAAASLLDADGIQSLRSLHQVCWRALRERTRALESLSPPRLEPVAELPAAAAPRETSGGTRSAPAGSTAAGVSEI